MRQRLTLRLVAQWEWAHDEWPLCGATESQSWLRFLSRAFLSERYGYPLTARKLWTTGTAVCRPTVSSWFCWAFLHGPQPWMICSL